MPKIGPYSKSVTAVIGQALTFASLYYGGNHWVAAATAAASALGVYAVPNQEKTVAPQERPLPPKPPPPPTGM